MSAIEFDTTELREILSKSISEYSNSLETIFADTESLKIKDKKIKSEFSIIVRQAKEDFNQLEFGFENSQVFHSKIAQKLKLFLNKYSEFINQEIKQEIENAIESCYLIELLNQGYEIIFNSVSSKDVFDFLQKIYQGLDLVAQIVENKGKLLEIEGVLSIIESLKKTLTPIVNGNLDDLDKNNEELKEIDRYRRLIDRTINSTLWYLDNYQREQKEEKREKERLEKEQKSLERLKAWVEEDQQKDLTKEELEEEDLVMKMIEESRGRKIF